MHGYTRFIESFVMVYTLLSRNSHVHLVKLPLVLISSNKQS